jgi:hypothetical protein
VVAAAAGRDRPGQGAAPDASYRRRAGGSRPRPGHRGRAGR